MKVLIVGSNGAQGKRYQAILNHLETPFFGVDFNGNMSLKDIRECTHVIIATPTDTHVQSVRQFLDLNVPILVEKPVCKDLDELQVLLHDVSKVDGDLSMVFQYRHLVTFHEGRDDSYYNYFRHGNDGLVWDCLQIIALAKGNVHLKETSPIWGCAINGVRLNLAEMDRAYVMEVREWLRGNRTLSLESIYRIHKKVAKHKL